MNADVHTLAGAYALDALPPEEARAFREHLDRCAACHEEVAELQATAAELGVSVAEQPPAALRGRVLESARQTRQVPPVPAGPVAGSRQSRRRLLLAAAAAAVVLGAGGVLVGQALDDPDTPVARPGISAVIEAPDARADTVRLRGGGQMTVIKSARLNRAVVISGRLPALPPDRVYQLWLVDRSGAARSAEVLIDPADPVAARARLVRGVRRDDQIAITREPAGGSEQPTMTPLGITRVT
jgi:anti-sigma-K factor RskA